MKGYTQNNKTVPFAKLAHTEHAGHKAFVELTSAEAAQFYNGPVITYRAVWNPRTRKYEPGERIS